MSQVNVKSGLASTLLGIESTFGTTASTLYRAFPVSETVEVALAQSEVENTTESTKLYDNKNTVRGLNSGTAKFDLFLRTTRTAYTGSNYPADNYQQQVMKVVFGGHTVNTGSIAKASPSTTAIDVDNPSYFSKGQFALFSTTNGLEPALITNIATDTLSVTPALSSAPASASVVANMDNFYPSETNGYSLTFQHAKADSSDMQWTLKGCKVNSFDLKLERDKLVVASVELEGKGWVSGSQSIATTYVTESLATPMVVKDATTIFQPIATTTRTQYPLESVSFKVTPGIEFLPELGGVEGSTGVMRTGERIFSEATLKFRADTRADFDWNAQNDMQLHVMIPKVDSNSVKRWIVVSMPTCQIVGKPKWSDTDGRLTCEVTVKSKLNGLVTSPATDLAYTPFIISMG